MCSVHNRLGRDHYARCAMRPKPPASRAEVSKECCPNSPWADITCTRADSSLRFEDNPRLPSSLGRIAVSLAYPTLARLCGSAESMMYTSTKAT
ncbi:hypothetical protein LSAT2_026262 [Lamellibrachia satsuma]|nr:hypothetical protein LSAT2_026262 [Lamellibrachia satsuma]